MEISNYGISKPSLSPSSNMGLIVVKLCGGGGVCAVDFTCKNIDVGRETAKAHGNWKKLRNIIVVVGMQKQIEAPWSRLEWLVPARRFLFGTSTAGHRWSCFWGSTSLQRGQVRRCHGRLSVFVHTYLSFFFTLKAIFLVVFFFFLMCLYIERESI